MTTNKKNIKEIPIATTVHGIGRKKYYSRAKIPLPLSPKLP